VGYSEPVDRILGLDELDDRLLRTIAEKYDGGPVGLETLAASIGEESDTIMDGPVWRTLSPSIMRISGWLTSCFFPGMMS